MRKIVAKNEAEVIEKLTAEIENCARQALTLHDKFRIGLSGGSVLNFLCQAIPKIDSDVSKWKFFFCDERYVPETDKESTFGSYKTTLLPQTKLKEEQFIPINLQLPLSECAKEYERKILEEFGMQSGEIPVFDLLLLGCGPDGHTCSLFPDHMLLNERQRLVMPISDSPKMPPQRVTMTLPLINSAACCMFAICGAAKADMVKRVFVDREPLPAAMVQPTKGELICIFDKAAGAFV